MRALPTKSWQTFYEKRTTPDSNNCCVYSSYSFPHPIERWKYNLSLFTGICFLSLLAFRHVLVNEILDKIYIFFKVFSWKELLQSLFASLNAECICTNRFQITVCANGAAPPPPPHQICLHFFLSSMEATTNIFKIFQIFSVHQQNISSSPFSVHWKLFPRKSFRWDHEGHFPLKDIFVKYFCPISNITKCSVYTKATHF